MKISDKLTGSLLLMTAAMIWGSTFVFQRVGMDYIGPITFNCIRTAVGGIALLLCIFIMNFFSKGKENKRSSYRKKDVIIGGAMCGIILFIASTLQQIGLKFSSAGKAGFITTLYIVIVPVLGIFIGRKIKLMISGAILLAVAGLYLLCVTEKFRISGGDFFILMCAFFFAAHIMTVDYFSPKVPGIEISCVQFLVSGLIGVPFMFIFETPNIKDIISCAIPILYAGVFSCGIAYTLQVIGQRKTEPTVASIIMSLESIFAVLAGWLILGEVLTLRETLGCLLVFVAVIITQLPCKAVRSDDKKSSSFISCFLKR